MSGQWDNNFPPIPKFNHPIIGITPCSAQITNIITKCRTKILWCFGENLICLLCFLCLLRTLAESATNIPFSDLIPTASLIGKLQPTFCLKGGDRSGDLLEGIDDCPKVESQSVKEGAVQDPKPGTTWKGTEREEPHAKVEFAQAERGDPIPETWQSDMLG